MPESQVWGRFCWSPECNQDGASHAVPFIFIYSYVGVCVCVCVCACVYTVYMYVCVCVLYVYASQKPLLSYSYNAVLYAFHVHDVYTLCVYLVKTIKLDKVLY